MTSSSACKNQNLQNPGKFVVDNQYSITDQGEAATIKPKEPPMLLASANLAGGLAEQRAKNKSVPSRQSLHNKRYKNNATQT